MRIGVVTDFYYPWIGGPATFIRNLGHGLSARGHSVSLLCPSADGRPGDELDGPMTVRRTRSIPVPFGYELRVSSSPLLDSARWLDDERPHVVHVHHPFPLCASAIWLAGRRGIPVVATNHTIPQCSLWGLRSAPLIYPLAVKGFGSAISAMLRQCTAVTTPTETAGALLRDIGFLAPVKAVSNGVDTERFHPGPYPRELAARLGLDERPMVLYTGRLDAEKRMDVWLRAAAVLVRALDVQFLVGGKGSERVRLEALSRELGLDTRLHFSGYLSDEEYPLVYRLADAYCVTSEVELQSISTLEAIASGLPAVGVRAGALPELIRDGENGYLAAPADSIGIAQGLHRLLSDPDRLSEMGRRSRTISEHHDLHQTVARYEVILTEASHAKVAARV